MADGRSLKRKPPQVCPSCGADVPPRALACPECGADHETGWNQDRAVYDGLDLPEKGFDYDEFVRREFGAPTGRRQGRELFWVVVGAIAAIALLCSLLF